MTVIVPAVRTCKGGQEARLKTHKFLDGGEVPFTKGRRGRRHIRGFVTKNTVTQLRAVCGSAKNVQEGIFVYQALLPMIMEIK